MTNLIQSKSNFFIFYSIYGIRKFGSIVKPDKPIDEPLKFEFHFYKVRCRMLQEQKFYIMKIIFDGNEYASTLQSGTNPKFNFDQLIIKEMRFNDMEKKYLEIIIFYLPSTFDIYNAGTIENILKKAKLYSSFKVDLLTLAVGPEFHNIILTSNKKGERLGRIMYTIACKQIANINVKINSVKIHLNELLQNNIALNIKYSEKNNKISNKSPYTQEIIPNLNQKEKKTEYVYNPADNTNNPLVINTKSSMIDFTSSDSYLNVYSIRLINKNSEDNDDYNTAFIFEHNPELKHNKNLSYNLMNHYTKIGLSNLSFLEILSENDEALNKQTSQFFRHVSGFNKPVEQYLHSKSDSIEKTFTIQIFQDISRNYLTTLYFDGNEIGLCEIDISIYKVPLIRQIMCGVLTENGFEINSIHLYDNILVGNTDNTLPEEVTKLINTKKNLDNELMKTKDIQSRINNENININNYLKELKKILSESVEVEILYYGYLEKKDLLKGQNVMLDIGISLLKIIDKVNKEPRSLIFDILKLINERGEFDLGTLSSQWFMEKVDSLAGKKIFAFRDNMLLGDKIIENFFEFNLKCLKYSLEKLNKGKMIEQEIKEFCIYFVNIAYFRIPMFRNKLLEVISTDVTEKFEEIMNRNSKGNMRKTHENKNIEDLLESDPINNLLLWENLFYEKLKSSLNENNRSTKIENEIDEKLKKLKDFLENGNDKNEEEKWDKPFLQRGNIFFGLIANLVKYILSKSESTQDVNWLNIPGFCLLLNALTHEIHVRAVNSYPPILKNLFKLFINIPEIPNTFIKEIIYRTNAYDVNGIFNVIDIIGSLFMEFYNKYPDRIFEKFNYNILSQVIKHILKVDHSLCVSKIILFYYNYAHIIPVVHLGDICQNIFGKKFYDLFFHWSFEVRDKFYYLILFIMGFKLKDLVPFQDLEDLKIAKNNSNEYIGVNFNKSFGDILENKLKIINEFQDIVKKENKDIDFNNKIDENKYKDILKYIPVDEHKNIVVSLHHYNKIYKEFLEFQRDNKNKKNRYNLEYPVLILIPPKDDYIEYEK